MILLDPVRNKRTGKLVERKRPALYPLVRHSNSAAVTPPVPNVVSLAAARHRRETARRLELLRLSRQNTYRWEA